MMETISAKELDRYVQDGRTMIIDLRPHKEYMQEHIRGAINVPDGIFRGELWGRQGETVVLYCTRGALSMSVARELEAQGYRTKSVVGGIRAYRGENMVYRRKT